MFNAKHFALSFAALAACTTEPATELMPQQSAEALAAAKSIGILPPIAASSAWTVYAQPMGVSDGSIADNIEEEDEGQPKGDPSDAVTDRPDVPTPESEDATPETPEEEAGQAEIGPADGEEIPGIKLAGDYTTTVLEIYEGQYGIEAGAEGYMQITGDDMLSADGFVPMTRGNDQENVNQFEGIGTIVMADEASGCEVEWTREIDGKMDLDGSGVAYMIDEVVFLDDACAEASGVHGNYHNAYIVALKHAAILTP